MSSLWPGALDSTCLDGVVLMKAYLHSCHKINHKVRTQRLKKISPSHETTAALCFLSSLEGEVKFCISIDSWRQFKCE